MSRRIELEAIKVEGLRLEGDPQKPDIVRLRSELEGPDRSVYQWFFEVPTWRLTDSDVALLRDLSFANEKTVRIVLEIDE